MSIPPEDSPRSLVPRGGTLLLLILAAGAGLSFLGYHRSHAEPQTAGSPVGAATSQEGRHLAPHDTFYLLQYVSAKTPTGVIGFEPGQQVRLVEVRRPTRTLVVGDGQAQVEVGPELLTNDMDIAALVRQKDQANQTKIAAYVQAEQKAYDNAQRAAAVDTAKDIEKINKQERDSSTVNADNSKLSQPPVEVGGGGGSGYGGNGNGNGYGNVGSGYYGSPYSYFSGSTATGSSTTTNATTAAPATGTARGATNPAATGH